MSSITPGHDRLVRQERRGSYLVAEAFRIQRDPVSVLGQVCASVLCRSPVWREIEPAGETALSTAANGCRRLERSFEELELPEPFSRLHAPTW